MSGHHAQKRSQGAHPQPAMVARLDQFAATIADARTQPNLAALADLEQQFLTGFHEVGAHLDPVQVGAAWMILGNLFAGFVGGLPAEQQGCGPVLVNLARLAGARLYTGSNLPVELPCPFAYTDGTSCRKVVKAPNAERANLLLGAHVWQAHPGETWPPVSPELAEQVHEGIAEAERGETVYLGSFAEHLPGEEGTAYCACGKPAELIVGETNRPDGQPGTAKAVCMDCARTGLYDGDTDGEAQS